MKGRYVYCCDEGFRELLMEKVYGKSGFRNGRSNFQEKFSPFRMNIAPI
jgi:hypothetical protein